MSNVFMRGGSCAIAAVLFAAILFAPAAGAQECLPPQDMVDEAALTVVDGATLPEPEAVTAVDEAAQVDGDPVAYVDEVAAQGDVDTPAQGDGSAAQGSDNAAAQVDTGAADNGATPEAQGEVGATQGGEATGVLDDEEPAGQSNLGTDAQGEEGSGEPGEGDLAVQDGSSPQMVATPYADDEQELDSEVPDLQGADGQGDLALSDVVSDDAALDGPQTPSAFASDGDAASAEDPGAAPISDGGIDDSVVGDSEDGGTSTEVSGAPSEQNASDGNASDAAPDLDAGAAAAIAADPSAAAAGTAATTATTATDPQTAAIQEEVSSALGAPADGWVDLDGARYYYSGGAPLTGQLKVDGKWYYLDPAAGGAMATGFVDLGAKTCYYGDDGAMRYGQQKVGGSWYYFGERTGAMRTGFVDLGAKTCYYGDDGRMQYGQRKVSGSWYYLRPGTGARAESAFVELPGKTCYYGGDGAMRYGQQKVDGSWYYLRPGTGARAEAAFVELPTKTVYYDDDGTMAYGQRKIDGAWYYFRPNTGSMARGIVELPGAGKAVYYADDGRMQYGQRKIGGYWYYFTPRTGAMARDVPVVLKGNFTAWGERVTQKTVFYFPSGHMAYGEVYSYGNWYYLQPLTGARAEGRDVHLESINATVSYSDWGTQLDHLESMVGLWEMDDSWYYFMPGTGDMVVDRSVTVATKYGTTTLYCGEDGAIVDDAILRGTVGATTLNGVDISNWDIGLDVGGIDADFVICKASQGTWFTDKCFADFMSQAKAAGKKLGAYHFAETSDPRAEAQWFVKKLGTWADEAYLFLDYEAEALGNGPEWCREFLDCLYELTGKRAGIYTSKSVLHEQDFSVLSADYTLWCAQYGKDEPTGYTSTPWTDSRTFGDWEAPTIYQYCSRGIVDGSDILLDINVFYGTESDWDRLARKA